MLIAPLDIEVEVVDVRAMAVADVEQRFARVNDHEHLDSQRLLQACVFVRVALLALVYVPVACRSYTLSSARRPRRCWPACRRSGLVAPSGTANEAIAR